MMIFSIYIVFYILKSYCFMLKVKKIREIKGAKVIRVLGLDNKPDPLEVSIRKHEPVSDVVPSRSLERNEVRSGGRVVTPTLNIGGIEQKEKERIEESRLYESKGTALESVGRTGSRGDERAYTSSEGIQQERMRSSRMGDFAMSESRSLMPENQLAPKVEEKMRKDIDDNKYGAEGLKGPAHKGRKMPWEV
jgi:hypothetical protein